MSLADWGLRGEDDYLPPDPLTAPYDDWHFAYFTAAVANKVFPITGLDYFRRWFEAMMADRSFVSDECADDQHELCDGTYCQCLCGEGDHVSSR